MFSQRHIEKRFSGVLSFPDLFFTHILYIDISRRLPPNKRTNFNKFAITSPFSFNWKLLISEWSGQHCSTFFVLRDRVILKEIQVILNKPIKPSYLYRL